MDDTENAGPSALLSRSLDCSWLRKLQAWHRLDWLNPPVLWLIGLKSNTVVWKSDESSEASLISMWQKWKVQFSQFSRNKWSHASRWVVVLTVRKQGSFVRHHSIRDMYLPSYQPYMNKLILISLIREWDLSMDMNDPNSWHSCGGLFLLFTFPKGVPSFLFSRSSATNE